jgi:hypothetical protein
MKAIVVRPGGVVCAVYSDALRLAFLGPLSIKRASHVEPDAEGLWWADLSPVQGPTLGPFTLRSEALAAELQWLSDRLAVLPID